ncbi:MAG: histidine kinase [Peptostreptococcaceae bacterium]|jgi:two-component system LytT family sensor kinase|nr:histidine kinase [Peptostreptococcaceae bacterium]
MGLLRHLINNLGYLIVISFLISRLRSFKKIIGRDNFDKKDFFYLGVIFGIMGIIGTYVGIDVKGAIANTRNIGVIVGGILCGPIVGVLSGIIAAIHRIVIDVNGITSLPCSIATILGGILSGFMYKKVDVKNRKIYGFLIGIIVENISMGFILIYSKPFMLALEIVKTIYIPMILVNAIGVFMVILIIEKLFEEKESIAGKEAKLALEIANKTLPLFRDFNEYSFFNVCKIIRMSVDAYLVVITDKDKILASSNEGQKLNLKGNKIKSDETKFVLKTGKQKTVISEDGFDCDNIKGISKSGIIVPLTDGDEITGSLKIYFKSLDGLGYREKYLALGLSDLISTQIQLLKIQNLKDLANEAEIKALQNQINPHFLFNALNTIVSFIRIKPEKARELIIDLSTYLRYNIENANNLVDIKKELQQIRAYVNIEKARFKDKINVIYNYDSNLDLKIPSLIIQPLVENSIKHGILKSDNKGDIEIEIKKIDSGYKITVFDNGIGISKDRINLIKTNKLDKKHIGLFNVSKRLKLLYDEDLSIESVDDGILGTKISFYVR